MEWLNGHQGRIRRLCMSCCSREMLQKRLPFLSWLSRYSLQWLQLDVIAGLTVGLTVVPQALAYAEVAGLPVQYGLYSSFVGCFVYCLLGTSKDVTLGPTAIMSLLVSVYTSGDTSLAILLAFLSGCIQLAMGLLNFGFLLDFISYPVIKAFTSAASVTIGFSQVKNLLGLKNIPREFILQVYETFRQLPNTRLGDAILGLTCIAILMMLKWMKEHSPRMHRGMSCWYRFCYLIVWVITTARNAVVVIAAGLVAYSFQAMGSQPFILTGKTAEGLPKFNIPPFSESTANGTVTFREMVQNIGPGLFIVPCMGLLESVAIARAFASQNNYRINTNQELLAIGLTNVLGSFLSSYPVTGSFGRTALNSQTGVCSPAGGLLTGVLVLLSLAYLTPLFFYIPKAALAAVIICAVAPMFDLGICKTLWNVKKIDLLPFLITFLLSFWEIQYGILAGILISVVILCYPIARPKMTVSQSNGLTLHFMSGLNFPAMEFLRDSVYEKALAVSPPRSVTLDFSHVITLDYTVVVGLRDLLHEFKSQGLSLTFCGLQPQLLQMLLAADSKAFHCLQGLGKTGDLYQEEGSTEPLLHNVTRASP
ncbi:sodium-independent sulfate anion transporter [Spea bombifrons]|uniref:sodium-independent sulfate anion transporter n=1 Tax=Spea bombifrons TaxID=233779 RepID=UPI00234B01D8|nr:sodium-independent sulfate anion transporter [Spea bombifrons]XP_053308826.1 sodium-independent sulfate anion transporter [Spea bombifrons]XP_053308827.1 sodium-independent sulfate anion transporter [Spea bombifrons]